MVLIKIDRKSIRKNSNVERTQQKVTGARNTTFICKGELPVYMKDGENIVIKKWSIESGIKEYKGIIIDESIIEKLCEGNPKKNKWEISVETTKGWNTVTFPPETRYFYKYKNTKVECSECGYEFMSNEFREFEINWDDDFSSTVTGCPECNAWDCCNIKYEHIEEIKNP